MANNLTEMQLASQIEELVRAHIDSPTPISPNAEMINDLGMDSLELVELSLKLEKQFGVEFSIADIRRCITLDDIIQLVSHTIQEKNLRKVEQV